jgi:hypothetical protein
VYNTLRAQHTQEYLQTANLKRAMFKCLLIGQVPLRGCGIWSWFSGAKETIGCSMTAREASDVSRVLGDGKTVFFSLPAFGVSVYGTSFKFYKTPPPS